MAALGSGAPVVVADQLRVILPPVALTGAAMDRTAPVPAGRYRVNLLSLTGQTWSVPSDLDVLLSRLGTPREDATQGAQIEIQSAAIPGGVITGNVELGVAPPAGDYQVVVFAFAQNNLPPPNGRGRPVASTIVSQAAFSGTSAPYTLAGIATGDYQVRAFLDANDDFVPWFDEMNQPDGGDVGGGAIQLPQGTLETIRVDALGAPTTNVTVTILPPLEYTTDRPVFTMNDGVVLQASAGSSVAVTLSALNEANDVLITEGVFPVKWVDLDGDGMADDLNGDTFPEIFPIVVAELIGSNDGTRIFGFVNPAQFAGAGFPAGDPTQVNAVVPATSVAVLFPAIAVNDAEPTTPRLPPEGEYKITVINPRGQTWTVPNNLVRAVGTSYEDSQARTLTVQQ